MNKERQYSTTDHLCLNIDSVLRTLFNNPQTTQRPYPVEKNKKTHLSQQEQQHSAGLMRINHAGEICAQALYQGQAVTSQSTVTREKMQQAALEEGDHLAWCCRRLEELGSHTSYLNPLWYTGSYLIGLAAGMAGDRWSLGFVAETEKQVVAHLQKHLETLPEKDEQSYQILQKMQKDEEQHREEAISLGAIELPAVIQKAMQWTSCIMVKAAYWI